MFKLEDDEKARLKAYILARLNEASTYRGIILILTSFGIGFEPEKTEAFVTIGLGLSGLISVFLADNK